MTGLKIEDAHQKALDEWFSRPVDKQRFYQLVYYTPSHFMRWKMPVGFFLVDTGKPKFLSVAEWTVPSTLNARSRTLVDAVLERLLRVDSKATLLDALPGVGPHFELGPAVSIPEDTADDELWFLNFFKGSA